MADPPDMGPLPISMPGLVTEIQRKRIAELEAEIERLKEGRFTEEEFQNLCHNMKPDDLRRFKQGCEDYQSKLFGFKRPKDEAERQQLKKHYEGMTEPCCNCGQDYPRGDLVIDGEVYCQECRTHRGNCYAGQFHLVSCMNRMVAIDPRDNRCKCSCATTCPLGRVGLAPRCTKEELEEADRRYQRSKDA